MKKSQKPDQAAVIKIPMIHPLLSSLSSAKN